MDAENMIWAAAAATIAICAGYFFNRWNSQTEPDAFITERRCSHTRGNCVNVIELRRAQMELVLNDLQRELQTVRKLLLVVATNAGIDPDSLKDLIGK